MTGYGQVCKMTLRPRRWLSDREIITQRCLIGECETCPRTYVGKGKTDVLVQGQDLWENRYCLCNTVKEEKLLDYGKYEEKS